MSDSAYRAKIDRLIREMSGEVVLNGSHGHAAIILERMFANAKEKVRILSRTLDPRIYGTPETVAHADLFLGLPNREARVLIEEPAGLDSDHPFLGRLRRHKNLQVRVVPPHLRRPIQINFAVMDACGLRFEQDKTEATAIALFGRAELTQALIDLFEQVWNSSEPAQQDLFTAA